MMTLSVDIKLIFIVFVFLHLIIICLCLETLKQDFQQILIRNLSEQLIPDCVILIWNKNFSGNFQLMKKLSSEFLTSSKSINQFPDAHSFLINQCSRPFYVVTDPMNFQETFHILNIPLGYSQITWLMFYPIDNYLNKLPIKFNNLVLSVQKEKNFLLIIEFYKVDTDYPVRSRLYANWSDENGLILHKNPLKRLDLEGIEFRAGIFEAPPLGWVSIMDTGELIFDGYFARVGEILEQSLNFSMTMAFYEENQTGITSWDKAIEELQLNKIDIIPSALEMASSRIDKFSFTAPIEFSTLDIIIRQPNAYSDSSWTNYVNPFPWSMLICLLVMYTIIWNLLYIADKESNYDWIEYGLYSIGFFFCLQSHPKPPSNASARLIHLSSLIFTLMLSSSYGAVFISFLTIKKFEMPFSTMQEMLVKRTHFLGVYKDTQPYEDFTNAQSGLQKEIYMKIMPQNNFPLSTEEALSRVCRENYAHIDYHSVLMLSEANCSLVAIEEYYSRSTSAMGLQRFSPYRRAFNRILNLLSNNGILHLLKKYPQKMEIEYKIYEPVSFSDIKFPLLIILIGLIMGLIFFICELIRFRFIYKEITKNNFINNKMGLSKDKQNYIVSNSSDDPSLLLTKNP